MFGFGLQSVMHQLILCYFLNKNLKHVVLYNCWSIEGKSIDGISFSFEQFTSHTIKNFHLAKQLMSVNITTSSNFLNSNNAFESLDTIRLIHMMENVTQMGILMQYDCPLSEVLIKECIESKCFAMNFFWLILNYEGTGALIELLAISDLGVDVEITAADIQSREQQQDNQTLIPLYDIYNNGYKLGGKLNVTFDRYFIGLDGAEPHEEQCQFTASIIGRKQKYVNRSNMSDTTFTFSAVVVELPLDTPGDILLDHINNEIEVQKETYVRFGYQYTIALHDMMKYKVKYVYTDRWSYNDSSGGAFGDLIVERADLAISPFLSFSKRLKYIRLVNSPHNYYSFCAFFPPKYGDSIGNFYFRPFTKNVWFCIIGAIIAFSGFLWFIYFMEKRKIWRSIPFVPSVMLTFVNSLGAMCQQGSAIIPRTLSGRFIHIMLFLTSVILYNYYTSEIVSVLIGSPVKSNIKNLLDLANSKLECGMEDLPYIHTFFSLATDLASTSFTKNKLDTPKNSPYRYLDADQGYLRIQSRYGEYAYCAATSTGNFLVRKYFKPHEICEYSAIPFIPPTYLGIYIKKYSANSEVVKIHLAKMHEVGVMQKHRSHYFPTKPQCLSNSVIKSVGLEHTVSIFLILAIGIILSLILLLFEVLHHKYLSRVNFIL